MHRQHYEPEAKKKGKIYDKLPLSNQGSTSGNYHLLERVMLNFHQVTLVGLLLTNIYC